MRRDSGERVTVGREGVEETVRELMESIQKTLFMR